MTILRASLSSAQLEALVGSYKRDRYIFDVVLTKGKLYANLQWENETRELIPESNTKFIMRDGQQAEFLYAGRSKITGLKLFGEVVFDKLK